MEGAARFDPGWIPVGSLAGLLESLAFAAEVGEERFERAREAAECCRELLLDRGAEVVTEPAQATLVSWRADDPPALAAQLAERGVVVRDLPGTGLVRASCGFWTSDEDLERLVRGPLILTVGRLAEQELDDDDVAPLSVEPRVPPVDADLAEAEGAAEGEARLVLGEDAANELPEAAGLASRTSASIAARPAPRPRDARAT